MTLHGRSVGLHDDETVLLDLTGIDGVCQGSASVGSVPLLHVLSDIGARGRFRLRCGRHRSSSAGGDVKVGCVGLREMMAATHQQALVARLVGC